MMGGKRYIATLVSILITSTALVMGQATSPYKIEKLSLSSGGSNEIAPVIIKDGIIFCSDKRTSSVINRTNYKDERLYNIYIALKVDTSSRWGRPERIRDPSGHLAQYGAVCIAPDNKTIYFTRTLLSGKAARRKKFDNPLGIFIGELNGTEINNVRAFEYNASAPDYSYNLAYPSISRDGKYLFFACDMPGGQGRADLYYCENASGKWSKPVNLGPKVNSASSENYPFMHPSGRLYFSSDRPSSASYMGMMDVYYTSLVYGEWDTPVPMPEPVNSKGDDFAFVAEDNLQKGYFTRITGPTSDIMSFKSTMIRKASCDSMEIDSYCYEFLDTNATRFDTIPFRYVWNFGDGSKATGIVVQHCFPGPGKYIVTIDVTNLVTMETKRSEKTMEMDLVPIEQPYISSPPECQVGQQIALNADSTYLPGWNIAQYYWNFGDESFAIGKEVTHKFIKAGEYNVQLIVTAAPDEKGVVHEACVSKNIRVKRIP